MAYFDSCVTSREEACSKAVTTTGVRDNIMEAVPPPTPPTPALNLENSPVPGQLATAVLDLQGTYVQGSSHELAERDAAILFEMFSQSSKIDSGVQRLCVSFTGHRYVVTRDASHVYIVQTRNE